MHSHLISQVVLKRFTDKTEQVTVHNKGGAVELKKPSEIAYVEIDKRIIAVLEKRWDMDIENHAEKTLNTLYSGGLLHVEKHMTTLKKLMGLHFVRSKPFLVLMDQFSKKYSQQVIDNLSAAYPFQKQLIQTRVEKDWGGVVAEVIPAVLEENISKVEKFMDRHGLEIGQAPDDTFFVIGDSPAITMMNDGRMGVLNGVPITEADSFAMPVTPHHLATLKTNPETKKYRQLTAKQVKNANAKQIQHSIEEYYSKPS